MSNKELADKVKIRAMIGARGLIKRPKTTSNWVLYRDLFITGMGTAFKECERLGIDPDKFTLKWSDISDELK